MKLAIYTKTVNNATSIMFVELIDDAHVSPMTISGYNCTLVDPNYVFASNGSTVIDHKTFLNNFDKFNVTNQSGTNVCIQKANTTLNNRVITTLTDTTTPLTLGRANTVQYLGIL